MAIRVVEFSKDETDVEYRICVFVVVFSTVEKTKTNIITSSLPGILQQLQIFHLDIAEGDQMDKFWANSWKMFCKNENDSRILHWKYTPAPKKLKQQIPSTSYLDETSETTK